MKNGYFRLFFNFNQNVGCTVMLKDVWHVQDLCFNLFSTHATDQAGYFNCYIVMKDENLLKDLCMLKEGMLAMICISLM